MILICTLLVLGYSGFKLLQTGDLIYIVGIISSILIYKGVKKLMFVAGILLVTLVIYELYKYGVKI